MTKPITIPKDLPQDSALSYDFLRAEGIKLIQQMAGSTWTDHNTHDPGITILEQLCYAITDLAYRIDYDIPDLLGRDGSSSYEELYGPAKILTVNPVTLLDLRKIVIDVEGVKNAWIEKVPYVKPEAGPNNEEPGGGIKPRGLYKVDIEKDDWSNETGIDISNHVKARLQAVRGVCEDFDEVTLLNEQLIRLQGVINLTDKVENVNQLIADVLFRVATYLSPRIRFYSLSQLLEQGKTTDEIFEGPLLRHGFINNEELQRQARVREVHSSDVIREIMDEEGISSIDELSVASGDVIKKWVLPLDPLKAPKLDVRGTLEHLQFTSQGLKANIDADRVIALYNLKIRGSIDRNVLHSAEPDMVLPETKDRNISRYYSIQNYFPSNFGLGDSELPESAPEKRKMQAKQLKAYLALFEQQLANYFSQTAHFKDLVSFDGDDTRTYFNQSLTGSGAGIEDILVGEESYEQYLAEMTADSADSLNRKNIFLNHLLARFGEKFSRYGVFLQGVSEGAPKRSEQLSETNPDLLQQRSFESDNRANEISRQLIKDKTRFLKDYDKISGGRAKAYDCEKEYWNTDNVSGLEKRIARKIGINDYTRRNLADADTEGFHMVEHILLRPGAYDRYPVRTHYTPGEITGFEAGESEGHTQCLAPDHTLVKGDRVNIRGNEQYEGAYEVVAVKEGAFEIAIAFEGSANEATWRRTQPDLRYHVLTESIQAFSKTSKESNTLCQVAEHNLQEGDLIEITGTTHYDGLHQVGTITENGFEIPVPFAESEATGRWNKVRKNHDPYSLQLTFAIPNWVERYQNDQFRKFVEDTIREETPTHLKVHVKWLGRAEMQLFDQAFNRFLSEVNPD
ncbi:hypothetical protein LVD17_24025 [Fulvivirga ulvae]|uniref:hypothetical protein n=1 Tax=Fulvivirga ulvae TaxID=2904245 RepID=UPI001F27259E|nr:hypothetical protein [Fulvivirga ulvae]UII31365.1 hypothetical protein LVD17_24025 [Fulvivirga ulvae]